MDQFNFSDYPNTDFNETNLDFLLEKTAKNTADIEELKAGGTVIDYENLQNLPKINGVTLIGDKSLEDIGAASADELSDVKSAITYVTPEMFGAVGDGVTDDSNAIQAAINSGLPVYMGKEYKIDTTININNDNTIIRCDGAIHVHSDIVIFNITSSNNKIEIASVKGYGGSYSEGFWHFNSTLFELNADGKTIAYNNIYVNDAEDIKKVFDLYANGTFGVMYNTLSFGFILAEYGIYMSCGNSGLPWINANTITGNRVRGNYGIYTIKGATQTDPYNGSKFNNMGFEGVYCAVKAEFFQYNKFLDVRMAESLNGQYWIDLDPACFGNSFESASSFDKDKINDLNANQIPNIYIAPSIVATINGIRKSLGLGGKVYKNSIGWTADKVFPAARMFTVAGDGNSHDMPSIGLLDGWTVNITRADAIAIINIPANSGYGYGNGAEKIHLRVTSGSYNVYLRYNGSNITGGIIPATDSGFYELRYMPNYQWILTKIAEL